MSIQGSLGASSMAEAIISLIDNKLMTLPLSPDKIQILQELRKEILEQKASADGGWW